MRPALRLAVSLLLVATQAQRAAEAGPSMDDHPTARSVPSADATPVADAPSGDPEPAAQWPALTADSTEELIVELTVNGAPAPAALIVRRDAEGALLIKASDLATLRLLTPADGGVLVDGELYYRIGSEPGVQLTFDPATQTAALALPPAAFAVTRTGAGSADTRPAVTTSPGGFINYDLYAERIDTMGLGAIAEAGVFGRLGVVTNSGVARDDAGERSTVRLDSTWTRDYPDRLATLRVGDAISAAGAWGRSARFGGLQFGTNFATQPTLVTTPLLSAHGEAIVPSTVDVFVNGHRRASEAVPPGPFAIENLPAITGSGQMQVVITDALGRQQVISQPYYSGATLLRSGLAEYSMELGAIREDYGLRSNTYGEVVAAGTYRRGISDSFTAEVHGEAQADGAIAIGADTAVQLGALGVLSSTAAAGGDDDGTGWLAGLGFEHSRERYALFARTQYASASFAQLGTEGERSRPRFRAFGGAGLDLARYGSLQLAYGLQTYWTDARVETIGLSHSLSLGARGFVNVSATHTRSEESQTELLLSWTLPVGERRTAGAALEYRPDRVDGDAFRAVASIQQSLPPGSGVGYVASVASNDEYQLGSSYQGRAGRVSAELARRSGEDGQRAELTGGLAITGAGVMPSRRLDESFAVVKVADYAGLTVFVDNQPVARTDHAGRVLLDSLRAYESNAVSIDPAELPLDAALAKASMTVVPAHRSGAVLRFPVSRVHAATLRLVQADGAVVPSGAIVELGAARYPVALDGFVYVEDLPQATIGRVQWVGSSCEFAVSPPATSEPVPDLGTIRCEPVAR